MMRRQRPKETYKRGGLSLAREDLFLQGFEMTQDILRHPLGEGGQRLVLIGEEVHLAAVPEL